MSEQLERFRSAIANRYTLGRELGVGGTATVFVANDERYHRAVAIKVFRPEIAVSLGHDRFVREIALAATLNHPHILPLLDSGEEEGLMYYVMPVVEGESLRERLLRERQLQIDEMMQIARDVAVALDYAHARGVVHRDIKPENILLTRGTAVVADFGIAKMLDGGGGETSVTRIGIAVGTALYMSPEQASASVVDGRADIYSLGCVVFEMLAGVTPYAGKSPMTIIAKHFTEPIPSVLPLRPGMAPLMDVVIMRALAKAPADRFATAVDFVDALAAARRAASHERVRMSMSDLLLAQAHVPIAGGAAVGGPRNSTLDQAATLRATGTATTGTPSPPARAPTPRLWLWIVGAMLVLAVLAGVWRFTRGAA
ncbi:MAG: serine/threonine-protein kinase [Gemmatimonadaceae bacterium]|nr:serine/threonine-protein kinase [Gemmatimonadaceae bacterium]